MSVPTVEEAVLIGQEVKELLGLRFVAEGQGKPRTSTTWGTKTLEGLGRCIHRITSEATAGKQEAQGKANTGR